MTVLESRVRCYAVRRKSSCFSYSVLHILCLGYFSPLLFNKAYFTVFKLFSFCCFIIAIKCSLYPNYKIRLYDTHHSTIPFLLLLYVVVICCCYIFTPPLFKPFSLVGVSYIKHYFCMSTKFISTKYII